MATPSPDSMKKLANAFKEALKSSKVRVRVEALPESEKMKEGPADVCDATSDTHSSKSFQAQNEIADRSSRKWDECSSKNLEEGWGECTSVENWPMDVDQGAQSQGLESENTDPAEPSGVSDLKIENIQAEVSWESDGETLDESHLGSITEKTDTDFNRTSDEGGSTRADDDSDPFTDTLTMAVTMEAGNIEKMADSEQVVINLSCQETRMYTEVGTTDKSVKGKSTTVSAGKNASLVLQKGQAKQELAAMEQLKHSLKQTCLRPVVVLEDVAKVPATVVAQRIMAEKKAAKDGDLKTKQMKTNRDRAGHSTEKATTMTVTLSVNEVEVLSDHGHVMMHIGCQEMEERSASSRDAATWSNGGLEKGNKTKKESAQKDQKRKNKKRKCSRNMSLEPHSNGNRLQRDGFWLKEKKRRRTLSRETVSGDSEAEYQLKCFSRHEVTNTTKPAMTSSTSVEGYTLEKEGRKQIASKRPTSNEDHHVLPLKKKASKRTFLPVNKFDKNTLPDTQLHIYELQPASEEERLMRKVGMLNKDMKKGSKQQESMDLGQESWAGSEWKPETEDRLTSENEKLLDSEVLHAGTLPGRETRKEPSTQMKTWSEERAKKSLVPQKHWYPVVMLEDVAKRDLNKKGWATSPISRDVKARNKHRSCDISSCDGPSIDIKVGESPNNITWSTQLIAQFQQEDADVARLTSWIRTNSEPKWNKLSADEETKVMWQGSYDRLVWHHGVLYIKEEEMDLRKDCQQRVVASGTMSKTILKQAHSPGTRAIHYDLETTFSRVVGWNFYWPHMQKSVRKWVEECAECSKQKESPMYRALYSYDAAEEDEVSLQAGDIITDTELIDKGWMFGTNRRSRKRGMLPANYVQKVKTKVKKDMGKPRREFKKGMRKGETSDSISVEADGCGKKAGTKERSKERDAKVTYLKEDGSHTQKLNGKREDMKKTEDDRETDKDARSDKKQDGEAKENKQIDHKMESQRKDKENGSKKADDDSKPGVKKGEHKQRCEDRGKVKEKKKEAHARKIEERMRSSEEARKREEKRRTEATKKVEKRKQEEKQRIELRRFEEKKKQEAARRRSVGLQMQKTNTSILGHNDLLGDILKVMGDVTPDRRKSSEPADEKEEAEAGTQPSASERQQVPYAVIAYPVSFTDFSAAASLRACMTGATFMQWRGSSFTSGQGCKHREHGILVLQFPSKELAMKAEWLLLRFRGSMQVVVRQMHHGEPITSMSDQKLLSLVSKNYKEEVISERCLVVDDLPPSWTEEKLRTLFPAAKVAIPLRGDGSRKGHAVLEFASRREMRSALVDKSSELAQLKKTELLKTAVKPIKASEVSHRVHRLISLRHKLSEALDHLNPGPCGMDHVNFLLKEIYMLQMQLALDCEIKTQRDPPSGDNWHDLLKSQLQNHTFCDKRLNCVTMSEILNCVRCTLVHHAEKFKLQSPSLDQPFRKGKKRQWRQGDLALEAKTPVVSRPAPGIAAAAAVLGIDEGSRKSSQFASVGVAQASADGLERGLPSGPVSPGLETPELISHDKPSAMQQPSASGHPLSGRHPLIEGHSAEVERLNKPEGQQAVVGCLAEGAQQKRQADPDPGMRRELSRSDPADSVLQESLGHRHGSEDVAKHDRREEHRKSRDGMLPWGPKTPPHLTGHQVIDSHHDGQVQD